jgi:hypothetical protein
MNAPALLLPVEARQPALGRAQRRSRRRLPSRRRRPVLAAAGVMRAPGWRNRLGLFLFLMLICLSPLVYDLLSRHPAP